MNLWHEFCYTPAHGAGADPGSKPARSCKLAVGAALPTRVARDNFDISHAPLPKKSI